MSIGKYSNQRIDLVHESQKDHKCDSCGRAFSSAMILKQHIIRNHNS